MDEFKRTRVLATSFPLCHSTRGVTAVAKNCTLQKGSAFSHDTLLDLFRGKSKAPSTRIRIFLNPQLFLSGYENIRVHTLCDHSVFISNSPVHTYSDSLRIYCGLTKLSHQVLVRPGLTQNRRGRHCFPTRLSCFCRPFCPVENVKSLQMSSRLLA